MGAKQGGTTNTTPFPTAIFALLVLQKPEQFYSSAHKRDGRHGSAFFEDQTRQDVQRDVRMVIGHGGALKKRAKQTLSFGHPSGFRLAIRKFKFVLPAKTLQETLKVL